MMKLKTILMFAIAALIIDCLMVGCTEKCENAYGTNENVLKNLLKDVFKADDKPVDRLEQEVASIGPWFYLLDGDIVGIVTYDKTKNEVIVSVDVDIERLTDADGKWVVDGTLFKEGLVEALRNTSLSHLIVEANASCSLWAKTSGKTICLARVSSCEMSAISHRPVDAKTKADRLLENYVKKIKSALPIQVADGVFYQEIELTEDFIIQRYFVNETMYNIKELEKTMNEHKYDKDPDPLARNEYDIYVTHSKGLRIEYYTMSDKSSPVFVISYTPEELKLLI